MSNRTKRIAIYLCMIAIGFAMIALGKTATETSYPPANTIALQALGTGGTILHSEHHPSRPVGLIDLPAYDIFLGKDTSGIFTIRVERGKVITKEPFRLP